MAYKVTIIAIEGQDEHPLVYMAFDTSLEAQGYIAMWKRLAAKAGQIIHIREENIANANMAGHEPGGTAGYSFGNERRWKDREPDRRRPTHD